jgi:GH24 family phage-related lysozyme (muramidase)
VNAKRLRALIAATHARGVKLAALIRWHPTKARLALAKALRDLNARRRARLAATLHPKATRARASEVSQNAVKMIKEFEGGRSKDGLFHPYRDETGVYTIGYGHIEGVGPHSKPLTEKQASDLLLRDLNDKYAPPVAKLGVPLNQNQFDSVVSFVYNLGVGMLEPSHDFGRLLRAHRLTDAANSMLEYDHAGGRVLEGLRRRRAAERKLFLS